MGLPEIAIVLIIALLVFGPKRLPELGRSLGRGIREFKGSLNGEHEEHHEEPARIPPAPSKAHGDPADAEALRNKPS